MKMTFRELINIESPIVDSIIKIMVHSKKEQAKLFLNTMNFIIDFYLNKQNNSEIVSFPIIYLPYTPTWAREVLVKFLILKLSLYYNDDLRSKFEQQRKGAIYLNGTETKKERDYILGRSQYLKNVLKETMAISQGIPGHKNVIFCNEKDIAVSREDKNKYISEFYGAPDEVFTDFNLIMCHNLEAKDFRKQLKEHKKDLQLCLDNAFLFYTNNDKSKSFELTAIEKWNEAYHVGLKNFFVFYFSSRPFCLRHIVSWKNTLCKIFPMITGKDVFNYNDFITFDQSEADLMFGRNNNQEHLYLQDDQLMFNDILGALINEMDYKIQERNIFSLCYNKKLQTYYKNHISQFFPDYDLDEYQISFDWQESFSKEYILPKIKQIILHNKEINFSNKIAIVVDKYVSSEMRNELINKLRSYNNRLTVIYYDYSALKGDKNNKANKIKESCVIILQYRPHYVNEPYYKYPNSFDPFISKEEQSIYDIIPGVAFDDMYKWDKYEYDKTKYQVLNCDFRNSHLTRTLLPQKPSVRRNTGETEFSDERTSSRSIKYVKGTYADGTKFSIQESALLLCEINGTILLRKMSDLINEEQIPLITKIQTLEIIENEFKNYVDKKTDETDAREKTFRERYYTNGLITLEEKESETSLWKILLNKRIDQDGLEKAYNSVMDGLRDHEKIQLGQFKRWADYNVNMILPLQRVCQRKLFEYLGFGITSPYLSIMRTKKAATKNGTRTFNRIMYKFFADTLLEELNIDIFDEYKNSEINDLLNFNNYDEFEIFVNILRNEINLKSIKSIE